MKGPNGLEMEIICSNEKLKLHLLHWIDENKVATPYVVTRWLNIDPKTQEAEWDYGNYFSQYEDALCYFCENSFERTECVILTDNMKDSEIYRKLSFLISYEDIRKQNIVSELSEGYGMSSEQVEYLYDIVYDTWLRSDDDVFDLYDGIEQLCHDICEREDIQDVLHKLLLVKYWDLADYLSEDNERSFAELLGEEDSVEKENDEMEL